MIELLDYTHCFFITSMSCGSFDILFSQQRWRWRRHRATAAALRATLQASLNLPPHFPLSPEQFGIARQRPGLAARPPAVMRTGGVQPRFAFPTDLLLSRLLIRHNLEYC